MAFAAPEDSHAALERLTGPRREVLLRLDCRSAQSAVHRDMGVAPQTYYIECAAGRTPTGIFRPAHTSLYARRATISTAPPAPAGRIVPPERSGLASRTLTRFWILPQKDGSVLIPDASGRSWAWPHPPPGLRILPPAQPKPSLGWREEDSNPRTPFEFTVFKTPPYHSHLSLVTRLLAYRELFTQMALMAGSGPYSRHTFSQSNACATHLQRRSEVGCTVVSLLRGP